MSWLVWHLTRVQDDHVAAAFGVPQVWSSQGWARRLGLPAGMMDHGYGHTSDQVAAVAAATAESGLLGEYHEATYAQTVKLVSEISDADLDRVVDTRWTPPVTLGVRLVSVLDDDMQHVGQAAYVRGIVLRGQAEARGDTGGARWLRRVGADEAPGLVADPGDDDGRAGLAGQLQAPPYLVDVSGQAATPDIDRAHVKLAEALRELPLVPRGRVLDAERAGERRSHVAVQGEERDLGIDLGDVAAKLARQVLDQACPGDGRVGVQEVLSWFA